MKEWHHVSLTSNKTQGFRVELQVSGGGEEEEVRDKTGTIQGQDGDKTGTN